jgi:hypothetical protein
MTGFQFGRRSGGGISARLYEKAGQAQAKGAEWWLDVWGTAYEKDEPVTRIEFEFGRTVLRECNVDTPEDLFRARAGLWGYATEWLSFRRPTADKTRSGWPLVAQWETVRNASLRDWPVTVARTTGARDAASERRIVAGLCGYVSSRAAFRYVDTIDEALGLADPVLREYERTTGIPFQSRAAKKRRRMGWGQ